MDYTCEAGAKRNFEIWRQKDPDDKGELETEEERLERLEMEEEERGAMANLETKVLDAKREMEIADALDEIRTRNARNERARGKEIEIAEKDEWERSEKDRIEREDEEAARRAFMTEDGARIVRTIGEEANGGLPISGSAEGGAPPREGTKVDATMMMPPPPTFKREIKKKKNFSAALGIKKKAALV